MALVFALCAIVCGTVAFETGFTVRSPDLPEVLLIVLSAVPAAMLLGTSLFGLATYFIFFPSVAREGHVFSAAHSVQMLHPLATALVLGLFSACIFFGATYALVVWTILLVVYLVETVLIVRRLRKESLLNGAEGTLASTPLAALNLILGGELVTLAAGARPLPPWKLDTLPEDTWIVDVRTKPEFHWNRLEAAENYPWGVGISDAARDKPKDQPVLVTCLSGHRSPSAAVALRRLGFERVYNLNWGILYLLLIRRRKKAHGPFALTRDHYNPHRRGEDLKVITYAYIVLIFATLIGAPLENHFFDRAPHPTVSMIGAILGLIGLGMGILSYRTLGRNFRVFAAPRRSGSLVRTGIYRFIRHPMYSGVIIGIGGYVMMFGSYFLVPLWLGVTVLYALKARLEEPILEAKFSEYEDYRKNTWRFLPFVY